MERQKAQGIRSHTQKRYAVLRTTEYTFRKRCLSVLEFWPFNLLPPKNNARQASSWSFLLVQKTRFQVEIFRFLQSKFIY